MMKEMDHKDSADVLKSRLDKLKSFHPRLEVRYWTGQHWEPLYGERLDRVLDSIDPVPVLKPHNVLSTHENQPTRIPASSGMGAGRQPPETGKEQE